MSDAPDTRRLYEDPARRPRISRGRLIALIAAGVVVAAAAVLIIIPVVSGIVDGTPTKYVSTTYRFSATFPAKPTEPVPSTGSSDPLFVRWLGNKKSISVQARKLTSAETAKTPADLVESALERGSSALGGEVTKAIAPTTLGGETASDVTFSIGGGDFVREYAAVRDGYFYAVVLLNPTSAEAATFLDSFAFDK